LKAGNGSEYDENGKLQYRGNFSNDAYDGNGRLYEEGRLKYTGNFEEGRRSGRGTSYYPNGRREYNGQWSGDQFHGNGTLYAENGRVEYRGKFVYGQRETESSATIAENKPRQEQQRNNYARNRYNWSRNRSSSAAPTNAWRYWSIFPIAEWGAEARFFNDDVVNNLLKKKALGFLMVGLFRFNYNNFGIDGFSGISSSSVQGIIYRESETGYEVYVPEVGDEREQEAEMFSIGCRVYYNILIGNHFSLYMGGGLEYFSLETDVLDESPDIYISHAQVYSSGGIPDDWVAADDAAHYSKMNPFLALGMQLKFGFLILRGETRVSPLYTSVGGSVGAVINW